MGFFHWLRRKGTSSSKAEKPSPEVPDINVTVTSERPIRRLPSIHPGEVLIRQERAYYYNPQYRFLLQMPFLACEDAERASQALGVPVARNPNGTLSPLGFPMLFLARSMDLGKEEGVGYRANAWVSCYQFDQVPDSPKSWLRTKLALQTSKFPDLKIEAQQAAGILTWDLWQAYYSHTVCSLDGLPVKVYVKEAVGLADGKAFHFGFCAPCDSFRVYCSSPLKMYFDECLATLEAGVTAIEKVTTNQKLREANLRLTNG